MVLQTGSCATTQQLPGQGEAAGGLLAVGSDILANLEEVGAMQRGFIDSSEAKRFEDNFMANP